MGTDADADADAQRNTDAGQRSSTAAVLAGRATTLPKLLQGATNHQVPPCRREPTVLDGWQAVHVYRVCGTDSRGPAGCWCGLLQSADAVVAFYDALPAVGVGGDGGAAGPAGARHEDEQGQQDDQDTADHHDEPDGGEVEVVEIGFDAERRHCAGDDQECNVSFRRR